MINYYYSNMDGNQQKTDQNPEAPITTSPQPAKIFNLKVRNLINSVSKQRRVVGGLLGILVLAGAIGAGVYLTGQRQTTQSQAGSAVLSMSATPSSVKKGDTFTVAVAIDTKSLKVSAADIRVRYETAKLEAKKIEAFGDFLPVVLSPGTIDSTDTASGRAMITVGALIDDAGAHAKAGTGVLAKITFVAKAGGKTDLTFGSSTAVAAVGQGANVVGTLKTLTLTIAGPTASSKPSASPSPTPNPNAVVCTTKQAYKNDSANKAGSYSLVAANKLNPGAKVGPGIMFVYAIYPGPANVNKNITITDTLPAQVSYVDGEKSCTFDTATRKVTCKLTSTTHAAFRVKVNAGVTANISNLATVEGQGDDKSICAAYVAASPTAKPKCTGPTPKGTPRGLEKFQCQTANINSCNGVDIVDVGIIIDNYGKGVAQGINPRADLNCDGKVDIIDVGILIDSYAKNQ